MRVEQRYSQAGTLAMRCMCLRKKGINGATAAVTVGHAVVVLGEGDGERMAPGCRSKVQAVHALASTINHQSGAIVNRSGQP